RKTDDSDHDFFNMKRASFYTIRIETSNRFDRFASNSVPIVRFFLLQPGMASSSLWPRFQKYFLRYDDLGFSIDISRMRFADDFFEKMRPRIEKAYVDMGELEAGAIANPDEHRMVGHYWLRNAK